MRGGVPRCLKISIERFLGEMREHLLLESYPKFGVMEVLRVTRWTLKNSYQ